MIKIIFKYDVHICENFRDYQRCIVQIVMLRYLLLKFQIWEADFSIYIYKMLPYSTLCYNHHEVSRKPSMMLLKFHI